MFRNLLFVFASIALVIGCTSKSGNSDPDPYDFKVELPDNKPLDPADTAQAKDMFIEVNGVSNGVAQLGAGGPLRPKDAIEDAILDNCKLIEDKAQTGTHIEVDGHSESIMGKTCPIALTNRSVVDYAGSENSLFANGRVQQQLAITGEPLLSMTDLRNVNYSGNVILNYSGSVQGGHLKAAANATGNLMFATQGSVEFFQKVRTNMKTNSSGDQTNGRTMVAQGAFVGGQWYIVVIDVTVVNGNYSHTCTLNGVDISADPACTTSFKTARKVSRAHLEYAK